MEATVWLKGVGVAPLATLSLQVERLFAGVLPSQIGALGIVQTQVKWPKRQHFRQ